MLGIIIPVWQLKAGWMEAEAFKLLLRNYKGFSLLAVIVRSHNKTAW